MLRNLLFILLCVTALVAPCSPVHAATIIITDLQDVTFGDLPPTSDRVAQRIRICVNSRPPGPYRLTALGLTSNGDFELINDARQTIPYDVYAGRRRNRLGDALLPGIPATGFNARRPNPRGNCRPPRIWITVVVSESALDQAASGRYRGTLQLTVAPE